MQRTARGGASVAATVITENWFWSASFTRVSLAYRPTHGTRVAALLPLVYTPLPIWRPAIPSGATCNALCF